MTFEQYWHKRTMDHDDIASALWLCPETMGNGLFHIFQAFAKEVWKDAVASQQSNSADGEKRCELC